MNYSMLKLAGFLSMAALMVSSTMARAAEVKFDVMNTGGNNFEYQYTVSGPLQQFEDFEITFDRHLFSFQMGYQPASPNADWAAQLLPPDPNIPADGIYLAEAVHGTPSLADKFIVDFQFLGGSGRPGSQPLAINLFDNQGNFISTKQTGQTTPNTTTAIPEPATASLVTITLAGLALCLLRHRTRSNSKLTNT